MLLGLLENSEFEINDASGENDNVTLIVGLKGVHDYIKSTISLYFPDQFKSHFPAHCHARNSRNSHVLSHYSLKLIEVNPL